VKADGELYFINRWVTQFEGNLDWWELAGRNQLGAQFFVQDVWSCTGCYRAFKWVAA
jgi:hypothetical protein